MGNIISETRSCHWAKGREDCQDVQAQRRRRSFSENRLWRKDELMECNSSGAQIMAVWAALAAIGALPPSMVLKRNKPGSFAIAHLENMSRTVTKQVRSTA